MWRWDDVVEGAILRELLSDGLGPPCCGPDGKQMERFNIRSACGAERSVIALPESVIGPGVTLELHIAVGQGDQTIAYWMLDDDVFLAEVEPGLA